MSLTSYRAAPPRDTKIAYETQKGAYDGPFWRAFLALEIVNGFIFAPAIMPGDALLFQRLSVSTIGADWFHGRVRDGIGWVTDAMVTKQ